MVWQRPIGTREPETQSWRDTGHRRKGARAADQGVAQGTGRCWAEQWFLQPCPQDAEPALRMLSPPSGPPMRQRHFLTAAVLVWKVPTPPGSPGHRPTKSQANLKLFISFRKGDARLDLRAVPALICPLLHSHCVPMKDVFVFHT